MVHTVIGLGWINATKNGDAENGKSGVLVQKPLENVPCFSKMTLLLGCFLQFDGYMRRTKSKLGIIAAEWIAVLVLTPKPTYSDFI